MLGLERKHKGDQIEQHAGGTWEPQPSQEGHWHANGQGDR
ncbi:hypothetical protein Hgul01_02516 [Herpetosiphon gulosus]|uniref:Uncharacterized protein n=1 Tax=Herpetosiphon gulosus TaxID=1973496 RepID=A0ABP9X007_9CHLR